MMISKNDNKKLLSNFVALGIVQGTNFLLPLLVMPFVIGRIGAAGFGVVAFAQVVMIYLSTIADYGFNITATKDVALYQADKEKMSRIFFTVLASKMFISVLLFLLLVLIVNLTAFKHHAMLYTMGFTYVIGQSMLAGWFFQGVEKMHYITISTLVSRLIFAALVFLYIRNAGDGKYFLFFLGMGNIVAGLISIYLAMRIFRLRLYKPGWANIRHELREGWQITMSNVSINTYLYSGIFILRIFTSDLIVGYYSVAERIFFAVRQVLSVFSQVVYPRICQLSREGHAAATMFFKKIYLPFLFFIIAGCGLLFILAPQIIPVFLAGNPAEPILWLRMLCFVPVIVCLNIPAYQLLLAFDYKKSYMRILATATVLNIIINIFLVREMGATGTALSIIITELFITAGLNRELYKNNLAGFINLRTA